MIEARCDMVDNLRTEGRYAEARRMIDSAESMLRETPTPRVEVTCLQALTDLENEAGPGHDRAVPAIRRAIFIRDSLGETRDMTYVGLFSSLANALDENGDHRQALATYVSAMAIFDRTGRGETMARAIMQHDYAVSLLNLGETASAEESLHSVLEIIQRSDPGAGLPVQPLVHYAHAALQEGDADSAAKYFALLVSEGTKDNNPYWEGRGLFGLAQAQLLRGNVSAARRTTARFDRVASQQKSFASDDQVTDRRVLHALLAMRAGDAATAHALVVEVLRSRGYFNGTRKMIFRSTLLLAAETALALGNPPEALGYARDARLKATVDSLSETRSAYVGEARLVEARAMIAAGDSAAARTSLARAIPALRNGAGARHARTRDAQALLAALR